MFNTIGILGLGLIGGSLAKAIKKYNYPAKVYGYNRNKEALSWALDTKVIDVAVDDFAQFHDCDLIILACPVHVNLKLMNQLRPYLREDVVISDVGSTKNDIYEALCSSGHPGYFIGGHPMAGSEQSGFTATRAELFENAYYIITPEADTPNIKVNDMIDFISHIHGIPTRLDPGHHDYIVAAISHVPHLIASSLVNMVEDIDSPNHEMYTLAAGGFKDFTRIASSSPQMWQEICMANKTSILEIMESYIQKLKDTYTLIEREDADGIYHFFEQSKRYRNTFENKVRGSINKHYALFIDIEDTPGVIAHIVSALSKANINIRNIGINNNREDFEGVLELIVHDEHSVNQSRIILNDLGYHIINND